MLVYGDRVRSIAPVALVEAIDRLLASAAVPAPGVARHAALVSAFVEAGELLQGLADAERAERGGVDARGPASDAAIALCAALGAAIARSLDDGWIGADVPASLTAPLRALTLPATIRARRAEGHAFYALYPEAYVLAARRLAENPAIVIGIRSIGGGLAAAVSAAVAGAPVVTVRPGGHPFRRELAVAPDLAAALVADPAGLHVIVDEGPGLSGSSFGAVADFLEDRGIAPERIAFLPGHAGDLGPEAAPRHRERWARARRIVVSPEELLLGSGLLARWVAEHVGPLVAPLEDVAGGRWRAHRGLLDAPANPAGERRKLLARSARGTFLVKFAGLGRGGERAFARAVALADAGFTPAPVALVHGWLVERWHDDARPVALAGPHRGAWIDRLAAYLRFRADHFAEPEDAGAPPAELLTMARRNVELALGADAAASLARCERALPALAARVRRIAVDARLHAWEWIGLPDGTLLKTDAVDHADAHDLIGAQDLTWDLAGAEHELALTPDELAYVAHRAHVGDLHADLLAFHRVAYLAFQLGAWSLAAHATGDATDRARLQATADAYAARLRTLIAAD